jgi:hypothetical protein
LSVPYMSGKILRCRDKKSKRKVESRQERV